MTTPYPFGLQGYIVNSHLPPGAAPPPPPPPSQGPPGEDGGKAPSEEHSSGSGSGKGKEPTSPVDSKVGGARIVERLM